MQSLFLITIYMFFFVYRVMWYRLLVCFKIGDFEGDAVLSPLM